MGAEIDKDLQKIDIDSIIINKGCNENIEEYGIDVLATLGDIQELHLVGLCYDYCVSSCAKETAKRHLNTKVVIKKTGTVAIDDNAKVDLESLPIIVE